MTAAAAFPVEPSTLGNSVSSPGTPGGWWLVRTGPGASEVQPYSPGMVPMQAKTGAAVYLGSTAQQIGQRITQAAHELGVPDPQNVPSLDTTIGIIGAELGGAAAGIAGASAAAGADAAAAGAGAAETGAAASGGTAGGAAAGGTAAKVLSKAGTAAKALVGTAALAALVGNVELWKGLGLIIAGVLILLIAGKELVKL